MAYGVPIFERIGRESHLYRARPPDRVDIEARGPVAQTELVRRARDGDRDAYDVLVTQSIDAMYRVARLILRDYDRASDAVQEALVRCWRDLPQLRDPERFDAWLNRILFRAVMEEARKRRRDRMALTVVPIGSHPDASEALADRDELARVFGRLSVEHRTMVVLHHYLGMTADQAASTIGIPVGTARSRLHYATEALRAALDADARAAAGRALA
jgi:RNA polymerase sigma-70 factor, ECF subfamily